MAGDFHFMHGRNPMAAIVMIREFQVVVGVGQFLARGFRISAGPER